MIERSLSGRTPKTGERGALDQGTDRSDLIALKPTKLICFTVFCPNTGTMYLMLTRDLKNFRDWHEKNKALLEEGHSFSPRAYRDAFKSLCSIKGQKSKHPQVRWQYNQILSALNRTGNSEHLSIQVRIP